LSDGLKPRKRTNTKCIDGLLSLLLSAAFYLLYPFIRPPLIPTFVTCPSYSHPRHPPPLSIFISVNDSYHGSMHIYAWILYYLRSALCARFLVAICTRSNESAESIATICLRRRSTVSTAATSGLLTLKHPFSLACYSKEIFISTLEC
jgi:hypothetical protein